MFVPVSRRGRKLRPQRLKGEPDHLFHNNGDGTFTDVTVKAHVEDKDNYYGFSTISFRSKGTGNPTCW